MGGSGSRSGSSNGPREGLTDRSSRVAVRRRRLGRSIISVLGRRPGLGPRIPVDTTLWVVRPEDLLVLGFDRINLKIEEAEGGLRLVKAGSGNAYLVVELPPQCVTEQAFFESADDQGYPVVSGTSSVKPEEQDPDEGNSTDDPLEPPPIPSLIGQSSRLVFRVPDEALPIPWTLEGILAAMGQLELNVPDNALPPPGPFMLGRFPDLVNPLLLVAPSAVTSAMQAAGLLSATARARRKLRMAPVALGLSTLSGRSTRRLLRRPAGAALSSIPEVGVLGRPGHLVQLKPIPNEPGAKETAIEMPYRVIVSPHEGAAWAHAKEPVTSPETARTELWHTRLGLRSGDDIIEGAHPKNILRAVWTETVFGLPATPQMPSPSDSIVDIPTHSNAPFRMSLDDFDRHNVVHLSSNFRLADPNKPSAKFEPEPLGVENFMLSSLGAWMDTRGAWETPQPPGLSVEEWRHRATMGRDHFVRVVYAGFLFPFGHRASLVKITERKFHEDEPDEPAYLRQRMYIVVREPVRSFGSSGLKTSGLGGDLDGLSYDRMMPFEAVRITTLVSPNLDKPENSEVLPGVKQSCFWPQVGNQPFRFHLVATDVDGNRAEWTLPLIFVGKEITDAEFSQPESTPIREVAEEYEKATGRTQVDLFGQKVAFAESAAPDDTAYETETLTWGVQVPADSVYDNLDWRQPRYYPVLRKAAVNVPSMQVIAGTMSASDLVFNKTFLADGFAGANTGQVFLEADPDATPLEVAFSKQSDRSGGFVSPDLSLSGLSRVTGPVSGGISSAVNAAFDPSEYFGALADAKLFGVFSLIDILEAVGFSELGKVPRFSGQNLNIVERFLADLGQLTLDVEDTALAGQDALATIGTLTAADGPIADLASGGDLSTVVTMLETLQTQLATLRGALSQVKSGTATVVTKRLDAIDATLDQLITGAEILEAFAGGDLIPEALNARFEWRPEIKDFAVFHPRDPRGLVLAVEAGAATEGSGEEFSVTASLDDFLIGLSVLALDFEKVQFRVRAGKKPEVDVVFNDVGFLGILAFIEALREVIPLDGFSDPPAVEVNESGITAGFSVGLPNISVGVFSLENLSISAGFDIPFVGESLSVHFGFCSRENPALLTVSMFGGGFFFGLILNPQDIAIFEAAIEFGASISVDFGVASGGVSAMAGLYFKLEGTDATLAGYFRMRGEVEALGLISVSIELYLEMVYETASGKCIGTATLTIEVDVTLFSVTVKLTASKKFAGSGADPTLRQLLDVQPDGTSVAWDDYCAAFAA